MPDISMCANEQCKQKQNCYRCTATPSKHIQTWAAFKPDETGFCEYFWDNYPDRGAKAGQTICQHGDPSPMTCPLCKEER